MKKGNMYDDMLRLKVLTKYGIIGLVVLMVLHCAFLLLGYDVLIVHGLLCGFGLLLGVQLNKIFKLCLIHRCCVFYIIVMLSCIVLKRNGVFLRIGMDLYIARWVMLLLGLTLLASLVYQRHRLPGGE